ncbi:hypothetical protein HK098_000347 [Nowakowskiella sp. JEL0407]|nr:hypothetical protein HK098_000347 [Nowakowskiella sp. JEL0407]
MTDFAKIVKSAIVKLREQNAEKNKEKDSVISSSEDTDVFMNLEGSTSNIITAPVIPTSPEFRADLSNVATTQLPLLNSIIVVSDSTNKFPSPLLAENTPTAPVKNPWDSIASSSVLSSDSGSNSAVNSKKSTGGTSQPWDSIPPTVQDLSNRTRSLKALADNRHVSVISEILNVDNLQAQISNQLQLMNASRPSLIQQSLLPSVPSNPTASQFADLLLDNTPQSIPQITPTALAGSSRFSIPSVLPNISSISTEQLTLVLQILEQIRYIKDEDRKLKEEELKVKEEERKIHELQFDIIRYVKSGLDELENQKKGKPTPQSSSSESRGLDPLLLLVSQSALAEVETVNDNGMQENLQSANAITIRSDQGMISDDGESDLELKKRRVEDLLSNTQLTSAQPTFPPAFLSTPYMPTQYSSVFTPGQPPTDASSIPQFNPFLITSNPLSIEKQTTNSRKSKKMIEYSAHCSNCNTFVCVMNFRGLESTDSFSVELVCDDCDATAVETTNRSKSKKQEIIPCEVCKRDLGSGTIKVSGSLARTSGSKRKRNDSQQSDGRGSLTDMLEGMILISNSVATCEIICRRCNLKYGFCSECGGGGKFRTGKFRPIEMFLNKRKTCMLSHARIGDRDNRLVCRTFATPSPSITSAMIQECKTVFEDGILSLYAIPKVMENFARFSTFESLRQGVVMAWEKCLSEMTRLTQLNDTVIPLTTFAWVPKQPRKKGRNEGSNGVSIAANISSGENLSLAEYNLSGFLICRWQKEKGTFEVLQMAAKMMTMQSLVVVKELLRNGLESAMKLRADNDPEIKYLYIHTRRDNTRLQNFTEKLGFVTKEVFMSTKSGINGRLFDMSDEEKKEMMDKLRRTSATAGNLSSDGILLEKEVVTHILQSDDFLIV